MDDSCPDALEKIFQKVEKESERRAQQAVSAQQSPGESNGADGLSHNLTVKARRRGSVSISYFGQLAEDTEKSSTSAPHTPNKLSTLASQSTFYQSQKKNNSRDSLASIASNDAAHDEDTNHVTQIHQIIGRPTISKAVGGLLPRRLSRSQSAQVIPTGDANMRIGVSVKETTVEVAEGPQSGQAVVHAPGRLRNKASTQSMDSLSGKDWVAKAKAFTKKFRRKSRLP